VVTTPVSCMGGIWWWYIIFWVIYFMYFVHNPVIEIKTLCLMGRLVPVLQLKLKVIPFHIDTSSKTQRIALQTVPKQVDIKISFNLKMGTDCVPQWSLCSFKHGIIDGQKVNHSKLFTILLLLPSKIKMHTLFEWYCGHCPLPYLVLSPYSSNKVM